ncbi:MAG: MMPL family transporter, partial [Acidimicrobiia bacterium]
MLGNLAAFVVRRARLVLAASVVVLLGVGFVGFGAFGKLQSGGFEDPEAESTRAAELISSEFGGRADLVLLVRAESGDVDSPDAAAAGARLTDRLNGDADLAQVVSYWETGAASLRSQDGAEALVVAHLADDEVEAVTDRYAGANGPL